MNSAYECENGSKVFEVSSLVKGEQSIVRWDNHLRGGEATTLQDFLAILHEVQE